MINAVVLDVDGVLVGTKEGINFPYPSEKVIESLRGLESSGLKVCLCSANGNFALAPIIEKAGLKSFHAANNGSVIFNPFTDEYHIHEVPRDIVLDVVEKALQQDIYTEIFTLDDFFILERQVSYFTEDLNQIRKRNVVLVDDLFEVVNNNTVVRIPLLVTEDRKYLIDEIVEPIKDKIDFKWSHTPKVPDQWIGLINPKGISKRSGVEEISNYLNIPLENILGVGDGINDWSFIQVCGYGGAMGNSHKELMDLVQTKGEKGYIGKHVDENGLLDIFKHFNLLS